MRKVPLPTAIVPRSNVVETTTKVNGPEVPTPSIQIDTPIGSVEVSGTQLSPAQVAAIVIGVTCVFGMFPVKKFGGKKPAPVIMSPAGRNALEMDDLA